MKDNQVETFEPLQKDIVVPTRVVVCYCNRTHTEFSSTVVRVFGLHFDFGEK